ncbi:MAG: glycoside hydrolase family 43 protein [Verrucomicrobiota bacterium]|jgi:beta-xylosidase
MQRQDHFAPRSRAAFALALGCWLSTLSVDAADGSLHSFHPGELWPDDHGRHINAHGGGLLHYGAMYYWFGEHKIAGELGNTAQVGVHVYSSRDLYNWEDRGIALPVSQDPSSEIAAGCILERPKVLFNEQTRKFVMWFHLEKGQDYSSARSGVAVADQVTGPYRYLYSLRPNAGVWPDDLPQEQRQPLSAEEQKQLAKYHFRGGPPAGLPFPTNLVCRRDFQGGQMARDMTLFLDDDGKAYHLYSSEENGTLQISQLAGDFLLPAGHYARLLVGRFNEAPALFKKDGVYFLFASGTTGWEPNPGRSFSAASLWGPWNDLGNPCRGTDAQKKNTFESQSTFVLPVAGRSGQFIFMADRWRPANAIDGRYVWLPVRFDNGQPVLEWKQTWSLDDLPARLSRAGD